MATTTTGKAIRQALAEQWGDWVFLGAATATGTTSYITDTERLQGANLPAGAFDNAIVRIGTGTAAGETAGVDYLDAVNGRLYLTPAITAALISGEEYEVWLRGIDPDVVDRLRDDTLSRFTSTWRPNPVTLIQDGDFEEPGVTLWTANGAATRTKGLAAFEDDVNGRWNLTVNVTTAATDFVQSESIFVQPGQRFYLEAPASAYTGAGLPAVATIKVRDVTQSADVSLGGVRTTHTGLGWGKISLLFSVPAGCYEIAIRLGSSTASAVAVFGPIACHRRDNTRVVLPDRIRTRKRVGPTFNYVTPSSAGSEQNEQVKIREWKNVEREQLGQRVVLHFNPPLSENATFYYERGFYARLSAGYFTVAQRLVGDAATTDCPKEYVVSGLAERISKFYMDKYGSSWQDDWVRASSEFAYWEGEFGAEPKFVEENEQPVYIPQIRV